MKQKGLTQQLKPSIARLVEDGLLKPLVVDHVEVCFAEASRRAV